MDITPLESFDPKTYEMFGINTYNTKPISIKRLTLKTKQTKLHNKKLAFL